MLGSGRTGLRGQQQQQQRTLLPADTSLGPDRSVGCQENPPGSLCHQETPPYRWAGRQSPPGGRTEREFGGQIIETLSHHKAAPGKLFEHTQISVQRSSETCLSD